MPKKRNRSRMTAVERRRLDQKAEKAREKYWAEKGVREKARKRARNRYQRKTRKRVRCRLPTEGPMVRPVRLGRRVIRVYQAVVLRESLGVSSSTLGLWISRGVLPEPTWTDENGWRWYSREYIEAMVECQRGREAWRLDAFADQVAGEFRRRRVK